MTSSLKPSYTEMARYYICSFALFFDLFFSLAFLLSLMRTFTELTTHQEWIALQMAGLSKKRLLFPFFLFAAVLSTFFLVHLEWIFPKAKEFVLSVQKKSSNKPADLYSFSLPDQSDLIYHRANELKTELFDVFWVRTSHDIWHMKSLRIDVSPAEGRFVNHIVRNTNRQLEKGESFDSVCFPDLAFHLEELQDQGIAFEDLSLSSLFRKTFSQTADKATLLSHLLHKLSTYFVPFLIVFTVAPFYLKFSRTNRWFLLSACLLFGLITVKVVLDGMLILGENQVVPPLIAILGPLVFVCIWRLPSFLKMH